MNPMTPNSEIAYPGTPPIWVDTPDMLDSMIQRLNQEPVIAVDTESDSLYAYFEKVCLIQFSVPGADYLVDPLALKDLSSLAPIFADAAVEKIFHAAEYDVMVLRRDYNFEFANLFDTMLASRILSWPRYGLGSILAERFGVTQDKRMQRHNWGRRPLTTAEMEYARLDTYYLLDLRELLLAELQKTDLLAEAQETFQETTTALVQTAFGASGARETCLAPVWRYCVNYTSFEIVKRGGATARPSKSSPTLRCCAYRKRGP